MPQGRDENLGMVQILGVCTDNLEGQNTSICGHFGQIYTLIANFSVIVRICKIACICM